MTIAQLTGRKSLRDLVGYIAAQRKQYLSPVDKPTSRATLARVNEQQSYEVYRDMFFHHLQKCQMHAPKHQFKFKGKIYLLNATTTNLCLSVFPKDSFRKTKGEIKLHFGLEADGYQPMFMDMTEGKKQEIDWANALMLPAGSCIVFDRRYTDYRKRKIIVSSSYRSLNRAGPSKRDQQIFLIYRFERFTI